MNNTTALYGHRFDSWPPWNIGTSNWTFYSNLDYPYWHHVIIIFVYFLKFKCLFLGSPRVTTMFRLFCSQLCAPKAPLIPHSLEFTGNHPLFVSVFPKPQALSCSRGFDTPNTLDVWLGFRHPILNLTLSAQTHFQLHSATTHYYKPSLRVRVGLFGPVVVSWRGRASRNHSCSPPAGPLSPGK